MKVYLKKGNNDNILSSNGVSLLYNKFGDRTGKENTGYIHLAGAIEVNVCSILKTPYNTEIAIIQYDNSIKKFKPKIAFNVVISFFTIQHRVSYIGYCKNTGKINNISYTQTIFIFNKDTDIIELLSRYGVI